MVYRGGLENRWAARSRGFESLPLRHSLSGSLAAEIATRPTPCLMIRINSRGRLRWFREDLT